MHSRILAALLLSACGAPPAPLDLEPSEGSATERRPGEPARNATASDPGANQPCSTTAARLAVQTMSPQGLVVRLARFESDGRALVAALLGEEFANESHDEVLSLRLTMGVCTSSGWSLSNPVPIGSIPKIAGDAQGRYERADVQLSAVGLVGESRAVQVAWRHSRGPPAERRVDRRSVRWLAFRQGPVDLGECTTRDLRSIDTSSFLQGHEVREWRVVPGTPPRLVGDRVAGGGELSGPDMVWSDMTDHRTLDVPLVEVEPDLSELCL